MSYAKHREKEFNDLLDRVEQGSISNIEIREKIKALQSVQTGIRFIDEATDGLSPGLTILGARSGSGKTELATQIAEHIVGAMRRVLYVAIEGKKGDIEDRIIFRKFVAYCKKENIVPSTGYFDFTDWKKARYFEQEPTTALITEQLRAEQRALHYGEIYKLSGEIIQTSINLDMCELRTYYPNDPENLEIDGPLTWQRLAALITSHSVRDHYHAVIIDHFHHIDFNAKDLFNEQTKCMHALSQAADVSNIPVILCAQFRKPNRPMKGILPSLEDFAGTSSIGNAASYAVIIERRKIEDEIGLPPNLHPTFFHVPKNRARGGVIRYVGKVLFNSETNKYEDKYVLYEYDGFQAPQKITSPGGIPKWAKSAIRPSF